MTFRLSQRLLNMYILAGTPTTPPGRLAKLAASRCDRLRLRVAENPATPKIVLERLSHDPNAEVRSAVATNPSCPVAIAERIARDGDVTVRHALAQSINSPPSVLTLLTDDENAWVRGEAQKTLEILETWSPEQIANARRQIRIERSWTNAMFARSVGQANVLRTSSATHALIEHFKRLFSQMKSRCA